MLQPKRLVLPTLPRQEEQAQIRQALKEVRDGGGARFVFLSGQSGTGKSYLIDKALAGAGAADTTWQARTKFDQRQTNAPLTNLRYLISDVIESSKQAQACHTLKHQLDPNQYQVLKAFLMDGDISDSEPDSDDEEESKWDDSEQFVYSNTADTQKDALSCLTSTLKASLRAITNVSTIVLTYDDIHWACKITQHVLKELFTDPKLKNLLVCATYRTNEETATEGFYEWKDKLEQEIKQQNPTSDNDNWINLHLDNLSQKQIQELLAEAVNREMDDVHALAATVFGFTHGNLFFTKHFLEKLQDDELLTFDYNQFKWQWDVALIKRRSSLSDNVVQSLASRIQKLPKDVQNVLMLAACFGAQFDVRALDAAKSALGVDCVYHNIKLAHQQEFVIQLNKTHYKFAHDMIQLASYGLLPEDLELDRVNWKIGSLLVQREDLLKDDAIFFACVDLLNSGAAEGTCLMECSKEKLCLLAKVNYKAGCKASKLSAFLPAARYLKAGVEALGANPFHQHYQLALKLYVLTASTEYVMGDIDASLAACQQVYENGAICADKILVLNTMFDCYVAKNDAQALMKFCFYKLDLLGLKLPRNPNYVYVQMEFQKMKSKLKSMSDKDILALPIADDAETEITQQILTRLIYPLYQNEEVSLCTLVACHMINLTLKNGWSKSSSAKGFTMAATFILSQTHDIREGYRLGQIAEKMSRRDGLTGENAIVLSNVASITRWWLEPVQNGLEMYMDANRVAMKAGQIGNAFQSTVAYAINYFFAGLPLGPLLDDVEKYGQQYLEYSQVMSFFLGSPLWQLLLCLTGKEENPANMYEGKIAAKRKSLHNPDGTGDQSMKSYQMVLSYYLGDLPTATKMAEDLAAVNPGIMKSAFWYTSRRFMMALVAIANYRLTKQMKDKATIEKHLKYFRKVVKAGAINLVHKLQILEAEYLTIGSSFFMGMGIGSSSTDDIFAKYDEAVVSASRSGFVQDAALANYLCFQFCKDKPDRAHMAELYLKRSFELWMSWGAVAVASSLVDRHKEMFGSESVRDSLNGMKDSSTSGGSLRGRARFDAQLSLQHKELNVN